MTRINFASEGKSQRDFPSLAAVTNTAVTNTAVTNTAVKKH